MEIREVFNFITVLKNAGFSDDLMGRVSQSQILANKMYQAVIGEANVGLMSLRIFNFELDYSLDLEQMIKKGAYQQSKRADWLIKKLKTRLPYYPQPGLKEKVSTKLFSFPNGISSQEAIEEMKADEYRPATAYELLAFGAKFPNRQKHHPVVGLGSVTKSFLFPTCLVLTCGHQCERILELNSYYGYWPREFNFLGLSNSY